MEQKRFGIFVGYGILDVPLQNPNEKARYICESNTNDSQFVGAIINRPLQGVDEYCTFVFAITFFIYYFLGASHVGCQGCHPLRTAIHLCCATDNVCI